jgi:NAD-dependent deacetylase
MNLERSAVGNQFAEHRTGPATRIVTDWVEELLGNSSVPQRPELR